jgi:hypothetical protein
VGWPLAAEPLATTIPAAAPLIIAKSLPWAKLRFWAIALKISHLKKTKQSFKGHFPLLKLSCIYFFSPQKFWSVFDVQSGHQVCLKTEKVKRLPQQK